MPWLVSDVKLTQFNCPLDQSSYGFQLVHGFLKRVVCHNIDYMCLEIVPQLSGSRDEGKASFSISGYRLSAPLNALLV